MSQPNVELYERVAKIEARVEHIDQLASERHGHYEKLDHRLDNIEKELVRYRGTVGAVLLIFTALGTFLKLFWEDVAKLFR